MTEYIEREAVKKEIKRIIGYLDEDMINRLIIGLDKIPAADVVARDCYDRLLAENDELRKERPVVRARWEINCDGYYPFCSNCKREPQGRLMTDFCPNCGAKMDRGRDDV